MRKVFTACLSAAAALAFAGAAAMPAGAAEFHGHHGGIGRAGVPHAAPLSHPVNVRLNRHFDNHRGIHRHHFRSGIYFAPAYSYGYYGDGCYWLKRKALNTGSRYWWHRYNECRWG